MRDGGMETEGGKVKDRMTKEGKIWLDVLQKDEEE